MQAVCDEPKPTDAAIRTLREKRSLPAVETGSRRESLGPGPFPGLRRPFRSLWWTIHVGFGGFCLVLLLAVLAAIPGLNILALGYLLDAQRRVAVSGRLRDGFPLLFLTPRLGVICLFTGLFLIPLQIAAFQAGAAMVIQGGAPGSATRLLTLVRVLQVVIGTHVLLAIACGGTAGCFLRPIRNIRWLVEAISSGRYIQILDTWAGHLGSSIRPVHHFWLGLKGAVGAVIWLAIPTALLVAYSAPDRTSAAFGLVSFVGGVLMIPVAAWLPHLQTHQAVTGRFRAIFELRAAREIIRRVPWSWFATTVVLYVLTLPLQLTKIKLPPADAFLIITPFFVLLTYPARILIGWSYHRGTVERPDARFVSRWGARLLIIPLLATYALFLFLTPAVSEYGKAAVLENHAFLSPAPRSPADGD